jgi:hypothetical protein
VAQEIRERDQETSRAVAALQCVVGTEAGLQRRQLPSMAQTLNSLNVMTVCLDREHETAPNGLAIHHHRACPANAMRAPYMCPSEAQGFT